MIRFYFAFVISIFSFVVSAQTTWQDRAEKKAINIISDFYASLNNYCDTDFSLDERMKFKADILSSYLKKDNSLLVNDLINSGSQKYTAEQYLDNLLAWFPVRSTIFSIDSIVIKKTVITDQGPIITLNYSRRISGTFNTNEKIKNKVKLLAYIIFPNNRISNAYIEKTEMSESEMRKFFTDKEKEAWNIATNDNSIDSYNLYLEKFPLGKYRTKAIENINILMQKQKDEIKKIMDNKQWELACAYNTIESYKKYIKQFPEGQFATIANERIDSIGTFMQKDSSMWQKAQKSNTITAYEEYLDTYTDGAYVLDAITAIKSLKNEKKKKAIANNSATPQTVQSKHEKSPESISTKTGNNIKTDSATNNDKNALIEDSLKHPSKLSDDEAVAYKQALDKNKLEIYRLFLKKFPNGKYAKKINRLIRNIDRNSWDKIYYPGSINSYLQYISLFPDSDHKNYVYKKIYSSLKKQNSIDELIKIKNNIKMTISDNEKFINIIDNRIEWLKVKKENTYEAYKEFMKNNPGSEYFDSAARKTEKIDWEKAKKENTFEAYKEYLIQNINGKHEKDAQKKINDLLRK